MSIVVLEDDDDLRESIADVLVTDFHVECVALRSVAELRRSHSAVMSSSCVIIDINLGRGMPTGLDAYRYLVRYGYTGKLVFLTGHARNHPLVAEAAAAGDAIVLEKPISMETLRALVESERHAASTV